MVVLYIEVMLHSVKWWSLPERLWSIDSEDRSLRWRRVSDEVLLQEVLAVRHHRHGQPHLPGVQLGPGVEDAILQEGDVADHLIGVCLR